MFNCLCINDLFALQRYKNFWTFLLFPLCFKALSTIYLQVGNFSKIIRQYIDGHRFIVRYHPYGSHYNSTYEAELYFDGKGSYKLTNNKWLGNLTEKGYGYLGYSYP